MSGHSANIVALKKMVRKMVREKLKSMAVERVTALSDAVSISFTKQRAYQEAKVVSRRGGGSARAKRQRNVITV